MARHEHNNDEEDLVGAFSRAYFDALVVGIQRAHAILPSMTGPAEMVAKLLVEGGDCFIASVRPDFMSEGTTRSGGFMFLKEYEPAVKLSERDAVIVAWTNISSAEDLDLITQLHASGAFIIGIGPAPSVDSAKAFLAMTSTFIDASLPLPATVTAPFKDETYPVVSLQNLALLWTFSGEVVSALTRLDHMPTMYQSVHVPGASQRNTRFKGMRFHEKGTVSPVAPTSLGKSYLQELANSFQSLRDHESGVIAEVSRVAAKTLRDGHNVHAFLVQHFPIHQHGAPGDPVLIQRIERSAGETPSTSQLEEKLKSGDLFMMVGYYRRPREAYAVAHGRGVRTVEVISGTDEPERGGPQPDYVIRPYWPYGDAVVAVPGYDVKILPSSGIVQAAIYWAVVGSMVHELDEMHRYPESPCGQ